MTEETHLQANNSSTDMKQGEGVKIHYVDVAMEPLDERSLQDWILRCTTNEGFQQDFIEIILCSDEYLLSLNNDYLNHNYYTDILTFDYSDSPGVISGGIYISYDRVKENALTYRATPKDELLRVIIHGVLHLMGYLDDTEQQKHEMTSKENYYLSLLS